MILSVGYDAESQTLEIEFNKGGLYQYSGVSSSEHEELMAANSIGKFFIAHIRDKYSGVKQ
jgi:hypothetical protein